MSNSTPPDRSVRRSVWPSACMLLLPASGAVLFMFGGRDDSYITYWPAYTLSHFGAVLNYNGEYVEQSSSLLHVVLLAGLHSLTGFPVPDLGLFSSVVFGTACVPLVATLARRTSPQGGDRALLFAATSPCLVYWSFGGLETTLVAFLGCLVVLTFASCVADGPTPSRIASMAGTTVGFLIARPEAPIVLVCVVFGAGAVLWMKRGRHDQNRDGSRRAQRGLAALVLTTLGTIALVSAFRLLYFGRLFPQPVYAKSGGFALAGLGHGIAYLSTMLSVPFLLPTVVTVASLLFAAIVFARTPRVNPVALFALVFVGVYVSFVICAGGDWMEAGRFLVPPLVVGLVFIPNAIVALPIRYARVAFSVVLLGQALGLLGLASHVSTGTPIWVRESVLDRAAPQVDASRYSWVERRCRAHIRDIPATSYLEQYVGRILTSGHGTVSVLTGQMGLVAYYTASDYYGRVRFIDSRGLADRAFVDCRVTSGAPKTPFGLEIPLATYIENRELIRDTCGIPVPDIIYDVDASVQTALGGKYTIVYREIVTLTADSYYFPGAPIDADLFIAIRNDLLPSLGDLHPVHVVLKS